MECPKIAPRLYYQAITSIVKNYHYFKDEIKSLPVDTMFDVYYNMYLNGQLCQLVFEMSDLDMFARILLQTKGKRCFLHQCFQSLMDHGSKIAQILATIFSKRAAASVSVNCDQKCKIEKIKLGLHLGSFLCEAGWFVESEQVLCSTLRLCKSEDKKKSKAIQILAFDVNVKLLNVYNLYYRFNEGNDLFNALRNEIDSNNLVEDTKNFNVSQAYNEFSSVYFCQSNYDEAYRWSIEALKVLDEKSPTLTIIDVLRQASKACVVKREFKKAEMLIKQALALAKEAFKFDDDEWSIELFRFHPKIADLFLDYGFYLLNVDLISQSVKLYEMALNAREHLFGVTSSGNCVNMFIAIAHEDLSYSIYVHEYSSGKFEIAKQHAEQANKIMQQLLPKDHLLLSSAKRVKALIMEEIAIDHHDKVTEMQMLQDAQELHHSALNLSRNAFGEMNVQTAKHYGNLGRLYQSMRRYHEAERMHLKAIDIKEKLLGTEDYEIALSLGHLASLYNYDMLLFEKAEILYLRSIVIGIKLFGESFSGLEYDYRGLLRVYTNLDNNEKVVEYMQVLHNWKHLRDRLNSETEEKSPLAVIDKLEKFKPTDIYKQLKSTTINKQLNGV